MKRTVRFPKNDPHSPDWWYERLETTDRDHDDFMAICPAHGDTNPSLHISKVNSGGSLVHCFAGCAYDEILGAVESPGNSEDTTERVSLNGVQATITERPSNVINMNPVPIHSPLTWLANYTGVDRDFLETLPLEERLGKIRFNFVGVEKAKERKPGSKNWEWVPPGGRMPPFWPVPSGGIAESIVITEGESDCLVARYLGADAYAYTGGASNPPEILSFSYLKSLGVTKVIVIPDIDSAGAEGGSAIVAAAENAGLETDVLDLSPHVIPVFGEKDLRDVFKRLGREETILRLSSSLDLMVDLGEEGEAYISGAKDQIDWVSKPLLADSTVTLLAGQPKAGKTTLLFQLMDALRSGEIFLGVQTRASRIFYMTEDSRIQIKAKKRDQMRGDLSHVVVLDRYDKRLVNKPWEETIALAGKAAVARGCGVLVIDTLAAWAEFEDENDATEVYKALTPVQKVAIDHELSVLVVHHLTKGSLSPRGSGAFSAIADTILRLSGEGSEPRKVDINSKILERVPPPIYYTLDERGVISVLDDTTIKDTDLTVEILDAVPGPTEQALTTGAILDELGWEKTKRQTLEKELFRLKGLGRVEAEKVGTTGPKSGWLWRKKVAGGDTFSITLHPVMTRDE